jgi:hypothetical protein
MNQNETVAAVNYANAIDARIQANQPTYELWHRVLNGFAYIQVQAAIQVFYERYADPSNRPTVDAPVIRKIIHQETTRNEAKGRAIEPPRNTVKNPLSFRARNPELWDRLYRQGRDDYHEDLRSRGITPHTETCHECSRQTPRKAAA